MIEIKYTGDALWERIERAIDIVKQRLNRVSEALNVAEIPYAVIGGNVVQFWVAQVDESVVRNTRDVDIILNRSVLDRAIAAIEPAGFIYWHAASTSMFPDGPDAKARDVVHVCSLAKKCATIIRQPFRKIYELEAMQNSRTLPLEAWCE